ncbi:MAG: TIGR04086 family membrane protein [Acetivibrionales bacterium]|jgi:putative membrane protein (TIGR04086 family)
MIRQKEQGGNTVSGERITLVAVIKGIVLSYVITIPAFIIFSIILTYVNFPQRIINPVVVVITIISILVAGISVTKNVRSKGWLNGGFAGLIYMIILYILGSVVYNDFTIDRYVITMLIIGVLTGCIGGMLGINMRPGPRKRIRRGRPQIKN